MQRLLRITLITTIAADVYSQEDREHQGPQTCGGRLKGPVGIIQTPNFPNPFPVPIKCRWIIEHDIVNGSISIYFTQQYTTSGLTFTEYMYYDESYKLGERKALTVTEENITRVKWLQVRWFFLVSFMYFCHLNSVFYGKNISVSISYLIARLLAMQINYLSTYLKHYHSCIILFTFTSNKLLDWWGPWTFIYCLNSKGTLCQLWYYRTQPSDQNFMYSVFQVVYTFYIIKLNLAKCQRKRTFSHKK